MGAKLREAREKRALTPAEVSHKTKIPQDFIDLAEESRFADFPPPVYSRSYLGQLCREYGMDPAPLLAEYKAVLQSLHPQSDKNQLVLTSEVTETGAKVGYLPRSTAEGQEKVKKLSPTMMAVGVVLIGLVVLGLIVAVLHNRGGGTGDSVTTGTSAGSQVNLESFVTPQQLPMKELPVPSH